jgi:hypothetical protein
MTGWKTPLLPCRLETSEYGPPSPKARNSLIAKALFSDLRHPSMRELVSPSELTYRDFAHVARARLFDR